jgi:hypothetical protein
MIQKSQKAVDKNQKLRINLAPVMYEKKTAESP